MIPLAQYGRLALSYFLVSVAVDDVSYAKVDGVDVPTSVPRVGGIQAAVDPSRSKALEKIFGGSVADGDIGIYTEATLYIQDQGDVAQSFVSYQGVKYRVVEHGNWTEQLGMSVYLARRHVL